MMKAPVQLVNGPLVEIILSAIMAEEEGKNTSMQNGESGHVMVHSYHGHLPQKKLKIVVQHHGLSLTICLTADVINHECSVCVLLLLQP